MLHAFHGNLPFQIFSFACRLFALLYLRTDVPMRKGLGQAKHLGWQRLHLAGGTFWGAMLGVGSKLGMDTCRAESPWVSVGVYIVSKGFCGLGAFRMELALFCGCVGLPANCKSQIHFCKIFPSVSNFCPFERAQGSVLFYFICGLTSPRFQNG